MRWENEHSPKYCTRRKLRHLAPAGSICTNMLYLVTNRSTGGTVATTRLWETIGTVGTQVPGTGTVVRLQCGTEVGGMGVTSPVRGD